jgi:hypothetical protein
VLGIGSWRLILTLIVALLVGSVWTTGLAAAAVRELNLISLAFGVLFFAVGVDFGTHLGLRYLEQAESSSPAQAIQRSVLGEGPAITLSVLCASFGFLSFLPTDYLGFAQLGVISAQHVGRFRGHRNPLAVDAGGLAAEGSCPQLRYLPIFELLAAAERFDHRPGHAGDARGCFSRNRSPRRCELSQPAGSEHRSRAGVPGTRPRSGDLPLRR